MIASSVIAAWDGWRGTIYRLAVAHRIGAGAWHGAGERPATRLRAVGAVRLQTIVVATDPRATDFWRATDWAEQVARLRFTLG